MCLYNDDNGVLVADEDIIVYKVLSTEITGFDVPAYHQQVHSSLRVIQKLKTPFRKMIMELGETYIADGFESDKKLHETVHIGLHTFKDKCDAKRMIKAAIDSGRIYSDTGIYYIVVECIIPKNTKYYKGTFYYGKHSYNSYTSEQLKLCN